ncbi:MAG TPA: hypothetical protein VGQ31_07100 [Candidatus Limnocylindrales bacterium]|jgi:hypothetical protein|nr:hypothetical protein [Candidatus Limnocylindrales bacterium]
MEPGTEAVRNAIAAFLGPAERVDRVVPAVGCALVLTNERLLVVREGASFRPKSGVRDWPLDRDSRIRMAPGAQHRMILERYDRSASVFLTRAQVDDAIDLINEVHARSQGGS